MQPLFHGLLEDAAYKLYSADEQMIPVSGAYLIAHCGFQLGCIVGSGHLLHTMEQTG